MTANILTYDKLWQLHDFADHKNTGLRLFVFRKSLIITNGVIEKKEGPLL